MQPVYAQANARQVLGLQRVPTFARSFERLNQGRSAAREIAGQLGKYFDFYPLRRPTTVYFTGHSFLLDKIRKNTGARNIVFSGEFLHMLPELSVEELLMFIGNNRFEDGKPSACGSFLIDPKEDAFYVALKNAVPLKDKIDEMSSWFRAQRSVLTRETSNPLSPLTREYSGRVSEISFELMMRCCRTSQDYLEQTTGERHSDFSLLIAGSTVYQATRHSDIDYLFIRGGGKDRRLYYEELSRLTHHLAAGAGAIVDCLSPAFSDDQWTISFLDLMSRKGSFSRKEYMIKTFHELRPVNGVGEQTLYEEFVKAYAPIIASRRSLALSRWIWSYAGIESGAEAGNIPATLLNAYKTSKTLYRLLHVAYPVKENRIAEWLRSMRDNGVISENEFRNLQSAYDFLSAVNDLYDIKRDKSAFRADIQNTAKAMGFEDAADFLKTVETFNDILKSVLRRIQHQEGHSTVKIKTGLAILDMKKRIDSVISAVANYLNNGNARVIYVVRDTTKN